MGWLARRSIDDEKLGPKLCVGAVRFCVVRNLITHARLERERAPILKRSVKLTFGAQEYVTLDAPVIREVAGRVLDHANTDFCISIYCVVANLSADVTLLADFLAITCWVGLAVSCALAAPRTLALQ